jgi:hypothetical protein
MFNLGGTLELPLTGLFLVEDPDEWNLLARAALIVAQGALMIDYGVAIATAGGIYAFAPNQSH